MSERVLPHSTESEEALLAAVLLYPELLEIAAGMVPSPEAFYLERTRAVWEAYLSLRASSTVIDLRTVQAQLEARQLFEKVGGMAYLAGLDLQLPAASVEAIQTYCRTILDRWARRRAMALAVELRENANNGVGSDEMVERAARGLDEINRDRMGETEAPLASRMVEAFDPHDEESDLEVIPTGFHDVDAVLGGFEPGQLVILAGRPRHGKTAMALQIARHATSAICRVRIQSLEMRAVQLRSRLLSQASGVPYLRIHRRQMTESERQAVQRCKPTLIGDLADRFRIDDRPGLTVPQIGGSASLEKLRHGLDLLIIDHSFLIGWAGRAIPMIERVGEMTSRLKSLAKELNVAIVLLHHLTRQHENDGRAPALHDLYGGQAVERDADTVLIVWRQELVLDRGSKEWEEQHGKATLFVPKHRDGADAEIELAFVGERMSFYDLSREKEPPF